jgi:hypothetical protein
MRFGGHETFAIREGWLHKGLKALVERPEWFLDDDLADWLGVGRNMAKSIRYWLLAAGLAEITSGRQRDRKLQLAPSLFGRILWRHDPYFTEPGAWWALHTNLIHTPDHAAAWTWFFNSFHLDRFDRAVCLENLYRHLQMSKQRLPNRRTLERDVACLLATYARPIPAGHDDPEEGGDCPFRELGLLSYFKTSGYYQLHQHTKPIPAELLAA